MEAWTDYPIEQLGDENYKIAPIREVEVLSYVRNKYCWVRVVGTDVVVNFKCGYIYVEPGRCGEVHMAETSEYNHLPFDIDEE